MQEEGKQEEIIVGENHSIEWGIRDSVEGREEERCTRGDHSIKRGVSEQIEEDEEGRVKRGDHSIKRGVMVRMSTCTENGEGEREGGSQTRGEHSIKREEIERDWMLVPTQKRKREEISPGLRKVRKLFEHEYENEKGKRSGGTVGKNEKNGRKPIPRANPTLIPRKVNDNIKIFEKNNKICEVYKQ